MWFFIITFIELFDPEYRIYAIKIIHPPLPALVHLDVLDIHPSCVETYVRVFYRYFILRLGAVSPAIDSIIQFIGGLKGAHTLSQTKPAVENSKHVMSIRIRLPALDTNYILTKSHAFISCLLF